MKKTKELFLAFSAADPKALKEQLEHDIGILIIEATNTMVASKKAPTVYTVPLSSDERKILVVNEIEGMYEDEKIKTPVYLAKIKITTEVEIIDKE